MRRSVLLPIAVASSLLTAFQGCATATGPGNGATPNSDGGISSSSSSSSGGGGRDAQAPSDAGSPPKDSGAPPADAGTATGAYSVSGPTILNASGKPHLFRGVARPSLEWSSAGDSLGEGDYTVMAAWGANVVRISLNQDFWLQSDGNGNANPNYDSGYAIIVDQQVQWAEKHGLDVILDLHWSDKGDFSVFAQCKGGTSGCQQAMADRHSILFWQQVATKYKGDPHVLFELYNEPNIGGYMPTAANWTIWLNGGLTNGFQAVGMQQLYDTVRKTVGAQNLVVIGGLAWAYDLSGVASTPVNGTNIIYATHPYQTDTQSTWTANFGSLSAKYPVIATEFGDRSGTCMTGYASNFLAYANQKSTNGDNPSNQLSWTAWAFYVASNACTFPTLLSGWYTTNAFGDLVKSNLTPLCSSCGP